MHILTSTRTHHHPGYGCFPCPYHNKHGTEQTVPSL